MIYKYPLPIKPHAHTHRARKIYTPEAKPHTLPAQHARAGFRGRARSASCARSSASSAFGDMARPRRSCVSASRPVGICLAPLQCTSAAVYISSLMGVGRYPAADAKPRVPVMVGGWAPPPLCRSRVCIILVRMAPCVRGCDFCCTCAGPVCWWQYMPALARVRKLHQSACT